MSKNITIQEGGLAKQLTVDKLKTNLVGSGTCLWVPEDEVQLTTKTITENGTYRASDDGYYGYEQVIVSIAGVGTATGTDGDGDEAVAHTDPETGELVIEKVPSRIEVVTPPTNPYGIYTDGQSISTNGMVVKAYIASGGEYGTVPNSEITLDPTTAHYDSATDHMLVYEELEGWPNPFATCGVLSHYEGAEDKRKLRSKYEFASIATACIRADNNNWVAVMAATENRHAGTYTEYGISDPTKVVKTTEYYTSQTYTQDGKTVYYQAVYSAQFYEGIPNTGDHNASPARVAWAMIYGTKDERVGSRQTITVSWPRPHDGKVLETTFEILVAPSYTPGGGE